MTLVPAGSGIPSRTSRNIARSEGDPEAPNDGPDAATFDAASGATLEPRFLGDTLAFMFETRFVIRPTKFALETPLLQRDYWQCWKGLRRNFKPE